MKKLSFEDVLKSANRQVHNSGSATALCHFAQKWLCDQFPDKEWGKVVSWKQGVLKIEVLSSTWSQQVFFKEYELTEVLAEKFPDYKVKDIKRVIG